MTPGKEKNSPKRQTKEQLEPRQGSNQGGTFVQDDS
jgi:hypothetical protein